MANRAFNKTGRYTNLYSETATTRADGELGSLDNDAQSPHARWKYFFAYSCVALAIALLAAWGLSRWFAFDFLVAFAVVALASIPIGLTIESQIRRQVDLLRPDRHAQH